MAYFIKENIVNVSYGNYLVLKRQGEQPQPRSQKSPRHFKLMAQFY